MQLYLKSSLATNKKSEIFYFQFLQALSWNIRSFLSLVLESSISRNIRHFFRMWFFQFSSLEVLSWNISKFHFLKYKKSFFEKIWETFSEQLFLNFLSLDLKVCYVAIFVKCSIVDISQCSEYTLGSEYTRVPNMLLVLNMLWFWIYLSRNIRKTFIKKI